MAFQIGVYRSSDRALVQTPPEVSGDEFDAWNKHVSGICLYDEPLGSDATVCDYWSGLGAALGLPLVTQIYQCGLDIARDDVVSLGEELARLEAHWALAVEQTETISYRIAGHDLAVPLLVHLSARADNLRAAIRLAAAADGFITIS